MTRTILNLVAFQAGWLACVLGAANGVPWVGALAALAAVGLHLALAADAAAEIRLIAIALALGIVFDSALLATGWVSYPSGVLSAYVAPYWILALWALFATALNGCMSWIKRSLPLAASLGAICGPLSYLAGARLGGIALIEPLPALVALALIWFVAMPTLVVAARRHNGIDVTPTALRLGIATQE
jgi:hypothetical protein